MLNVFVAHGAMRQPLVSDGLGTALNRRLDG